MDEDSNTYNFKINIKRGTSEIKKQNKETQNIERKLITSSHDKAVLIDNLHNLFKSK